jgi:soluble lytic murein transglycosylase
MASIDTNIFLNYKTLMIKSIFAYTLIILLAACTAKPASNQPTTTELPLRTATYSTPQVTPTGASTPALLPSPTMAPEVRINTGERAFFNGDYLRAQAEFQAAYDTSSVPAMKAAALWGLGRVKYSAGNKGQAIENLSDLVSNYSDNADAARANFLLGEIFFSLERYDEAIYAYTAYLEARPGILDGYVLERCGDAYTAVGNFSDAVAFYQKAMESPPDDNDTALQIKIAQTYASSGDTTTALGMYSTIAQTTTNDYIKAQMDLLEGQANLARGETDQAYAFFQDAVNKYPLAYDSYSALVALVNAGITVDELNRGLVDYYAGQPGYAVEAFQRYIDGSPENDGTALYYMALAYYDMGQFENAVVRWNAFIDGYSENPHWAAAWNGNASLPGRAYTQWYWLGDYDLAANSLLTFINHAPNDTNAPIFIMEAARIMERNGKLEEAANTWERVADEYPNIDQVPQALFWAGLTRYRAGRFDQATVTFQRDLQFSSTTSDQARAFFWIGKTKQIQGDTASAQVAWQQAAALDPTDYYSLRSADMLIKRSAFDPPAAISLIVDLAAERATADAWLRVTFNLPPETDLSTPGEMLDDPRLVRGTELWNLGMDDEARLEFEDLRSEKGDDPAASYRLANYLLDLGLYRSAIMAMRQVLTLAGMNTQAQTLAAPVYFNYVRYGLYYKDLIIPSAEQARFAPLFLFSVIRQESLFEGFVYSTAGARGLMQITPDTGKFIAGNLGWPQNYTSDDLYRPTINISLGVHYLDQQRTRFDGDLFAALAAYNAGPETAPIWLELSGPDPDLFLEVIRFEETRAYIRSIYENYNMYRTIYATVP